MTKPFCFTLCALIIVSFVESVITHAESHDRVCSRDECPNSEDGHVTDRQCRLFVAESSIPNAGLGMYSGVDLAESDEIHSEIVIHTLSMNKNFKLRRARTSNVHGLADENGDCRAWAERGECDENGQYMWQHCVKSCFDISNNVPDIRISPSLLTSYYWDSSIGHGTFISDSAESLLPGVGMLANSHPGLINVVMTRPSYDNAGLDRRNDPGVGAFSSFHNYRFLAKSKIQAGQEIFAEYGDNWFASREHKFGLIPLSDDYSTGNSIVHNFRQLLTELDLKDNITISEDAWYLVRDELLRKNTRLQMILPPSFSTIEQSGHDHFAVELHSASHVIRDIHWLNENGRCMDGLRVAPSTIPQAGRGAFASRNFRQGQTIYPVPVVHVERQSLQMYKYDSDNAIRPEGEQLLLNYCYGHPESSLLLFPYSPLVNYINHSRKPNVILKWSTMKNHRADWLELSTHEVLEENFAGLIIDVVAVRDISEGEEILLDYGDDWATAWETYVSSWSPDNVTQRFVPVEILNAEPIVRTEEEQLDEPYPDEVVIHCFFARYDFPSSDNKTDVVNLTVPWDDNWSMDGLMRHSKNAHPCRIAQRYYNFTSASEVYNVHVKISQDNEFVITSVPREAIYFHYRHDKNEQQFKTVFRKEIKLPESMVPLKWRDIPIESKASETNIVITENDDGYTESKCRFYLAESSIPNAGIGIFAGTDLSDGDITQPDIALHVIDHQEQKMLRCELDKLKCDNKDWVLISYVWNSMMTHANRDANSVSAFTPGIGAIGNFHPGFSDATMVIPNKTYGGLNRGRDPAAGAISSYHGLHFELREPVARGMEIFISYGEEWLHDRESILGKVPLRESYLKADLIVKKFHSFIEKERKMLSRESIQKFWSFIRQELTFDERITKVLPDLELLDKALKFGTAGYSLPVRTSDWLKRNGSCLDNIRSGPSSTQGIGLGAFAKKPFVAGEAITTTPLIQISRDDTVLLKRIDGGEIIQYGHQLILNYCYGHQNSSLLLLPYSPVVNYINHNGNISLVNARIEWSSSVLQKSDWLKRDVDDILNETKTGLLIDIVAIKDIKKGDEIFLHYGSDWQRAWDLHAQNWVPKANHIKAFELEQSEKIVKTKSEQKHAPYPSNVMIVCFVPSAITENSTTRGGVHGEEYLWYESAALSNYGQNSRPCEILNRELNDESKYVYTADVLMEGELNIRVGNIPRGFIKFVDKPYAGDEQMEQTFRHEIGIADNIFPTKWMDLKFK